MRRAVATLAAAALALAPGAAAANPSQDLAQARSHFTVGEWQKTADAVYPLLYPTAQLADAEDLTEAHYLLGASYFFLDQRDLARKEFVALLYIDPEKTLDRGVEPAPLVDFYDEIRLELKARLDEMLRQRRIAEEKKRPRLVLVEREYHPTPAWANFVPFGIPQFQRGQKGWGTALLASQVAFGGLSVGTFAWQMVRFGYPPRYANGDERNLALTLSYVQVGAGAFFWVSYIAGVAHALFNKPPAVTEKRTERLLGLRRLELAPYAAPDRAGLFFTMEF